MDNLVELVVGGYVINKATLSSFNRDRFLPYFIKSKNGFSIAQFVASACQGLFGRCCLCPFSSLGGFVEGDFQSARNLRKTQCCNIGHRSRIAVQKIVFLRFQKGLTQIDLYKWYFHWISSKHQISLVIAMFICLSICAVIIDYAQMVRVENFWLMSLTLHIFWVL